MPTATSVAAGSHDSCVILSGGFVSCWGWNLVGELGDGTMTQRLTPILVSGITTATAVTTGDVHACALLSDHTARCWGDNQWRQLGDGTTLGRLTPVKVSGISTATAISAGISHTCALLADDTVRCWGDNGFGQLGNNGGYPTTPVKVAGISSATAISSGRFHTCALLANRTVRCWGENNFGQLGDGTRARSYVPVAVSGISTAIAISAGSWHTCALLEGGAVKCWGSNYYGQLGDATTTQRLTPVGVPGISTATAISAGSDHDRFGSGHSCAVLADGTARCWGENDRGQLGDGATTIFPVPVPMAVSGISAATSVSAGSDHSCAVMADGVTQCWGSNEHGQLGDGTTASSYVPVAVVFPATPFTDIASSPFKPDIEWVYTAGITSGCTATTYCPSGYVTREQMASFLARALHLSGSAPDAFTDDEASPHEPNINLVAKAGIASGCAVNRFCPTGLVSREQMASFLARALHLAGAAPDAFTDDETSIHEPNINLVAREGVATGCGNNKYCPTANVTRGQMAAFLHRAFGS